MNAFVYDSLTEEEKSLVNQSAKNTYIKNNMRASLLVTHKESTGQCKRHGLLPGLRSHMLRGK